MEVTGRAVGASIDFDSGHLRVTFEINETEKAKTEYEKIKSFDKLKIKAVRYTRRRPLTLMPTFMCLLAR